MIHSDNAPPSAASPAHAIRLRSLAILGASFVIVTQLLGKERLTEIEQLGVCLLVLAMPLATTLAVNPPKESADFDLFHTYRGVLYLSIHLSFFSAFTLLVYRLSPPAGFIFLIATITSLISTANQKS